MKVVILQPLTIAKSQLETLTAFLSNKGYEISSYNTLPKDKRDAIERAKNADILVLVNYPFDKESIDLCPNLKMISVAFTGFDHVDIERTENFRMARESRGKRKPAFQILDHLDYDFLKSFAFHLISQRNQARLKRQTRPLQRP